MIAPKGNIPLSPTRILKLQQPLSHAVELVTQTMYGEATAKMLSAKGGSKSRPSLAQEDLENTTIPG